MSQEGKTSRKPFTFVSRQPHLPGGVFRFTEWASEYSEAVEKANRRGWERQYSLRNGDTVVRAKHEEDLEDAARDRDARRVKRLQATGGS